MDEVSAALAAWQQGGLGRAVAAAETRLLSEVCDDVFGLEILQLGAWGLGRELLGVSHVRHQTLVAPQATALQRPDVIARLAGLPVGSGCIDAVVLPHCLETVPDPGAVLREAERVLVGEGQLFVFGFSPWSLWGLRALVRRGGYPPGTRRLLPEWRLREWLTLLGFEVAVARRYLHGGYLLRARKRVYAPTRLRLRRREPTPILGSLVNPSP